MNGTKRLTNTGGWVLCALLGGMLVWMLTGCTSYQEQPRARGGNYEDQPSPGVAYVAAPQVETSYAEIRTENDFYEPLSPYGRWGVVGSYEKKVVPAQEPGRIQRPTATTTGLQPAATKKDFRQAYVQNRPAKLAAEQRAQQEKALATESEKSQPAAEQRAEIQGQKEQLAVEKRAEQEVKQAKESEKEEPNRKGKEQEASPENPGDSPQSPR